MANIPLLLEVFAKFDAEFLGRRVVKKAAPEDNHKAWMQARAALQQRQDDALTEAFGNKAKRLQQLRLQFVGLPTVLYETPVADAVGISAAQRDALIAEANKRQAVKPPPAAAKEKGKPVAPEARMTFDEFHEKSGRIALELLTAEQRRSWLALIGPSASFKRPAGWSFP